VGQELPPPFQLMCNPAHSICDQQPALLKSTEQEASLVPEANTASTLMAVLPFTLHLPTHMQGHCACVVH
jgi:hypothetical protein